MVTNLNFEVDNKYMAAKLEILKQEMEFMIKLPSVVNNPRFTHGCIVELLAKVVFLT